MKPKIFNGKKFAQKREVELKKKVFELKKHGVFPKLATVLVGSNPASELYVNLKKKAAERVGIETDIYKFSAKVNPNDIILLIKTLNEDKTVQGIMVQMPLPDGEMQNSKFQIINSISPEKDVDGLRDDSKYLHPTSKAVIDIVRLALKGSPCKVAVVGATGMVGKPLVKELKKLGYDVVECDLNTPPSIFKGFTLQGDVLISATGVPNLIKSDMVKDGAVVIDVGSPKGDVNFGEVAKKASFITPVPGGVGPVTISCLLGNLVSAC